MTLHKDIYLFMGPPGAGKGSLSKLCVGTFGWKQFSTGNLCRWHISNQTEIGKQIDFAIKSGKLVSDSLVTTMIDSWLSEIIHIATGVILDGFPRTVAQAQAFEDLLKEKFKMIRLNIVKLMIPDEHVIMRLADRYICQNNSCQAVYSMVQGSTLAPKKSLTCDDCSTILIRRGDDSRESVVERLKTYYAHEKDLLSFYQKKGQLINEIDVNQSLSMIFENFKRLVTERT